jgi:hypothetical protein
MPGWIATHTSGKVLHLATEDGWVVQLVVGEDVTTEERFRELLIEARGEVEELINQRRAELGGQLLHKQTPRMDLLARINSALAAAPVTKSARIAQLERTERLLTQQVQDLTEQLEKYESLTQKAGARCPHYWGTHDNQCLLPDRHDGEHRFAAPSHDLTEQLERKEKA